MVVPSDVARAAREGNFAVVQAYFASGPQRDVEGEDAYVGTELDDGWWAKARVKAPPDDEAGGRRTYVCCRGAGRSVESCDHLVTVL